MSGRYTLATFYNSREWLRFTRVLRTERINENGDLICAHCGEPIVKAYDCICHHVIELNENNVNDVMISLNPDNILLVHHRCHNRIHEKFCLQRQVFLVYGPPLAGKTTYVNDIRSPGDLIVDIDSIWQCISGCDRYDKPKRLNQCVFKVRDSLLECIKYRVGKWNNAYIIGGYPLISDRERICKRLGAREIFLDTDKEECIKRLEACEDGRNKEEWLTFINQWWRRYAPRSS